MSKLKADELRRRLREHGLRGAGRRKVDMALMLANALRSQRMAPFPSQVGSACHVSIECAYHVSIRDANMADSRPPSSRHSQSHSSAPSFVLAIWQSTDRFSDRRGRCVSGRAVCVDMPRGPNGYVLCRVCQVRQVTTYALSTGGLRPIRPPSRRLIRLVCFFFVCCRWRCRLPR